MTLPSAEQFSFTLTLGGRYAGQQEWTLHSERGTLTARVQTEFGGVLPEVRRVQTSRMHAPSLSSLHYAEGDGYGRANFETGFDRKTGVVTLRQGRDEAEAPLTVDHHDPVSLLLWLRTLDGKDRAEAQLTGGKALIQRLADVELDSDPAYVYFLRPGGAYVYVEQAAPHRLLRLIQPTDFGPIEANPGGAAPVKRQSGGKGRRRVS